MRMSRKSFRVAETSNEILRRLSTDDLQNLWSKFERVALKPKRVLHYLDTPMEYAYFIEHGLISVLAHTGDGKSAEVWLIGREGLVGVPLVLGESISAHRRVVLFAGSALRIHASDLADAMQQNEHFRTLMLQYVHSVLIHASQLAGCNAQHSVQQRLARWLLMAHDRCQTDALPLTHEMLSRMLGVRRATVSDCTAMLEQRDIIKRERALIRIQDRRQLKEIACSCYRIMRSPDYRSKQ